MKRTMLDSGAASADRARRAALLRDYLVPVLILLIAGVSIVLAQWAILRNSERGYQTGRPAPETYRVVSPIRYDDHAAAEALRRMANESVVGVTVRDVAAKDRLNRRLTELRAVQGPAQEDVTFIPGPLLNAIVNLSDDRRQELLDLTSRVGNAYIDRLESGDAMGNSTKAAILWAEINRENPSAEDANLVYQILAKLGNLVYHVDSKLTEGVRRLAEKGIPSIVRRLEPGDVIVELGQVVTPQIASLLHMQGYAEDAFPTVQLIIVLVLVLVLPLWLEVLGRDVGHNRPSWMCVVFTVAVSWLCGALATRLGSAGAGILPAVLTVCLCVSGSFAFSVALAGTASGVFIITGLLVSDLILLLSMSVVASTAGFYLLMRLDSREQLTRRVFALAVLMALTSVLIRWLEGFPLDADSFHIFPVPGSFWMESGRFVLIELVMCVVITLLLPMVESYIGVLSILRLRELSHPSSPLLRELQRSVPGTYQHCLTIATLIEEPAMALGMDVNLVKAGAYYHDIGKLHDPLFFVENQGGGFNPHDGMTPTLSAYTIISHVRYGLDKAQENGLPRRLRDFIAEHHGTTCVRYFYNKALAGAGKGEEVDRSSFCYPGPRPQSRETALLMIVDSLEAAVRSMGLDQELQEQGSEGVEASHDGGRAAHPNRGRSQSIKALERTIDQVIASKMAEGQFDDVDFTLKDVTCIKAALLRALLNMYHTRRVRKIERPQPGRTEPPAGKEAPAP